MQVARSSLGGGSEDPVFGSGYASESAHGNSGSSSSSSSLHKQQSGISTAGPAAASATQQGDPVPAQAASEPTSSITTNSVSSSGDRDHTGDGGPQEPEDPPPSLGVR